MKKRYVAIISGIALIIVVLAVICSKKNELSSGCYVYPSAETYEDWYSLTTKERIEVCRISEKTLKRMTDEQLIQAIFDFPFNQIDEYSNLADGVQVFENNCDAYAELVRRDSGFEVLMGIARERAERGLDNNTVQEKYQNDLLAPIILYQEKFQDKLTVEDEKMLKSLFFILQSDEDKNNNEQELLGYYVYPDNTAREDWNDLTVREKMESYRIPPETLKSMTDEQLIQAIFDYPFNQISVYDYLETGVHSLETYCDAYIELLARDSGFDSLMKVVEQSAGKGVEDITVYEEINNDLLAAIILYQEKYQDKLTVEDKKMVLSISNMVQSYENYRHNHSGL